MAKKEIDKSVPVIRKNTRSKSITDVKQISQEAFQNDQLNLFQSFLCNTAEQRSQLSNTIALWDSIPRYSVSRQTMSKLRSTEGTLKLLKLDFRCQDRNLKAVVSPARIEVIDPTSGETVEQDFYPSAAEELIEDALRKISADQQQGFFDKSQYSSGAVFTLHMLREELKRRGHTRSYQEIIVSLRILAKSSIEIIDDEDRTGGFAISPYLPSLAAVTRKDLQNDPEAKWVVQFHPLVTRSIDQLTYRQFNYHQMMSHKTQLARWLHKQLALKFTFASHGRTFVMRFSTIKRDSALLNGHNVPRKAFQAVDEAFNELKAGNILMFFVKEDIRGPRNKLEDTIYTLTASIEFISEMKAANKRAMMTDSSIVPSDVIGMSK